MRRRVHEPLRLHLSHRRARADRRRRGAPSNTAVIVVVIVLGVGFAVGRGRRVGDGGSPSGVEARHLRHSLASSRSAALSLCSIATSGGAPPLARIDAATAASSLAARLASARAASSRGAPSPSNSTSAATAPASVTRCLPSWLTERLASAAADSRRTAPVPCDSRRTSGSEAAPASSTRARRRRDCRSRARRLGAGALLPQQRQQPGRRAGVEDDALAGRRQAMTASARAASSPPRDRRAGARGARSRRSRRARTAMALASRCRPPGLVVALREQLA